jgi:hypothetical protein
MTATRQSTTTQAANALRAELNRLQRALVRETDQGRCDEMERRIVEQEQEKARRD